MRHFALILILISFFYTAWSNPTHASRISINETHNGFSSLADYSINPEIRKSGNAKQKYLHSKFPLPGTENGSHLKIGCMSEMAITAPVMQMDDSFHLPIDKFSFGAHAGISFQARHYRLIYFFNILFRVIISPNGP